MPKKESRLPRLDTISYYDNTEPNGDDSIYFPKIEQKRGRVGIHIDGSKLGSSPASLECSEFRPLPGALGAGRKLGDERADVVLRGGYRAVLSGIGGDEFLGGVPDPRAHLADLIVQFKLVSLAKQLTAWSLVKRRPWIQLLWQSAIDVAACFPGPIFGQGGQSRTVDPEGLCQAHQTGYPTVGCRRALRALVTHSPRLTSVACMLMACKLAKFTPPVSALEEARYPYLDQNLIEFILSIPASQLLRPGERRSLMRRSLAGIVPQEILSRRTKQVGARTPVLVLEKHWDELQSIYQTPLSARLGYIDEVELLKTICDARAGKSVPLVRVLWTISLEYWLRDLAARGLLDTPCGSLVRRQAAGTARERIATASNDLPSAKVMGTEYFNKGEPQ